MARPVRTPEVPTAYEDMILKEVALRAEARRRASRTSFDASLGATAEEVAEKLKSMRDDINVYGEYVYDKKPTDFHKYWNKIVDDVINRRVPQNKVLFIAPPNTAKSTWNSIIRATHYLGNHPDEHVVNVTSSDENAKDFDGVFARTLDENQRFHAVFDSPLVKPIKKRWSSDGRFLKGLPEGDRHPTYRSVGMLASIMGARANIILDDPLDQKNAQSETAQRTSKAYLDQTLIPRLQPSTGWMIGTMTRFHEFDLASHCIQLAQDSGDWIYVPLPMIATEDDPIGRLPGELLWPDRFNQDWVDRERRRMTTATFNMIHQCDPTGMGGDVFKEEAWFRDLPKNFWRDIFPKCKIIMASDLAMSEKKKTCYTVLLTVAIDREFNMYVLHVYRGRLSPPRVENMLTTFIRAAKPIIIGLEEDNFHKKLIRSIARNVLKRVMCNIRLMSPDRDKQARALLPAARAEHGQLFVDKRRPWYQSFVMECLGFPNTRYKDQVDTLSLVAFIVQSLEELTEDSPPEEVEYVA